MVRGGNLRRRHEREILHLGWVAADQREPNQVYPHEINVRLAWHERPNLLLRLPLPPFCKGEGVKRFRSGGLCLCVKWKLVRGEALPSDRKIARNSGISLNERLMSPRP